MPLNKETNPTKALSKQDLFQNICSQFKPNIELVAEYVPYLPVLPYF